MYLTKINCDLLISSALPLRYPSHKPQPFTLATVHRKKSTCNFVVHITKVFSNKSFCAVKVENIFLILNSNGNGTVKMNDVCLIFLPLVAQTVQLKRDFFCRSERICLFICNIK